MGEVLKLNSPKRVAITCKFAFTGKSLIEWMGNIDEKQISNVFPPTIITIKMIEKHSNQPLLYCRVIFKMTTTFVKTSMLH